MYKIEKSSIKNIDINYLNSIGFKKNQTYLIYDLIHKGMGSKYILKFIFHIII